MSENDSMLIKRSKQGDVEAFEKLIEDYQTRVFNIALRMLGSHEDANDMAQEVFLRVYKSLGGFKEQSSFSTWIYRITKNVCLDELRRRKNKNVVHLDEEIKLTDGEVMRQLESKDDTPDVLAERNEMRKQINGAINELNEEHKMVIVLRDIQGFSYEEIAEIVGCPEGTVKSRINRARKVLREELKNKLELITNQFVK